MIVKLTQIPWDVSVEEENIPIIHGFINRPINRGPHLVWYLTTKTQKIYKQNIVFYNQFKRIFHGSSPSILGLLTSGSLFSRYEG